MGESFAALAFRNFSEWGHEFVAALADSPPVVDGFVRHANLLAPLNQREANTAVFVLDGRSSIPNLIGVRCPATVLRAVVAVVVDSVYGVPIRAFPHVGKEILEHMPPVAYFYTPTSILGKRMPVGVLAPLPHTAPNVVRRGVAIPVSPVCSLLGHFSLKAPTGLCAPVPDIRPICIDDVATVANKPPYGAAFWPRARRVQGCQSAKPVPSNVHKSWVRRVGLSLTIHGRNSIKPHAFSQRQDRNKKCMEAQ